MRNGVGIQVVVEYGLWYTFRMYTRLFSALGMALMLIVFSAVRVDALTATNNWDFNGNATGWSSTNDNGTSLCGDNTSSTADVAMATLAYSGGIGGQTGFQAVTTTGKNIKGRGMVHQTITAPGTGTVKAKGRISYYATSTAWNASANTSWIRLDLFDSSNAVFVANLFCASFNSNQAWTTSSFSSAVSLTGGTTYTIRATMRGNNLNSNGSPAVTLAVDNVLVTFAPVGLSVAAPADTKNASLTWTGSTAGTGAPGLHATTPYNVYRDTTSPVATFLSNASTNSYSDSSTVGNTIYYYAVTNVDTNSVESPLSGETNILTRPDTPGTPTFTNVGDGTLTVNWTAPTGGASSYKVERCMGSGCSDFNQIATGETGLLYSDSGLTSNTLYRYRVRATNATGDGAYSGIGEATTSSTPVISVTLTTDGAVGYGTLIAGSSTSTVILTDTQMVKNDGNVAEDFNIKGQNTVCPWVLAATNGTDQYVHEFSTTSGSAWTALTTAYQSLITAIAVNGTQNLDLRMTVPTTSSCFTEQSADVTIQAVQH